MAVLLMAATTSTIRVIRPAPYGFVRCPICGTSQRYDAEDPDTRRPARISLSVVRAWAYEDGWRSVSGYGWLCPDCVRSVRPHQPVTRVVRALPILDTED